MRNLGRIRIFAVTIKKFLKKLARTHAEEYACLQPEFTQRYLGKDTESYFSRVKPSLAAKTLDQVSTDLCKKMRFAFFLIESFRAYESICSLPEYKLLERVLREQCTVVDTGEDAHVTIKPPREISPDSLQNPSDPDASYDAHKGQGFQVQIMETYQPEKQDEKIPNLITHVKVEPAHVHDSHAQRRVHEQTPEFRHKYRWRSGIEGTNSHLKSDVGTARLRVRGLPAVCFAVTLKALALNILRCARALAARFLARITSLCFIHKPVKHEFSVVTSFALFFVENTGFYLSA